VREDQSPPADDAGLGALSKSRVGAFQEPEPALHPSPIPANLLFIGFSLSQWLDSKNKKID
jgi:hypothetical protein